MDWRRGYTSTIRLYSVDQSTWGDGVEIDGLVSASISKDVDSSLIEDADISIDGPPIKGYVRIVLEANNNSDMERADLGTFLVTTPKKSISGDRITSELECYSVLKPASDKLLPIGWYFPEGGDPIAGACDLLSESLICPIIPVESDINTENVKIAEDNETYLSMAQYLLKDTGWHISIDGRGIVTIKKEQNNIVKTFNTFGNDVIIPDIEDENDIYNIPNILRVTDSDGNYETIMNYDEDSEISINNLGWEKWSSEQISLGFGETLIQKGNEKMEELSKSTRKISYSREFDPDVNLNDVALYLLPHQGIVGSFRIISQSMTIGKGVLIKEIATFESKNWRS